MATIRHKAKLMLDSLNRLQGAMKQIAEATCVNPPTMPEHNRDPELLMAYRLATVAMWAEDVARFFEPFGDGVSEDSEESPDHESPDEVSGEIPAEELSAEIPAGQLPEIDDGTVGLEQEALGEEPPQDKDDAVHVEAEAQIDDAPQPSKGKRRK